MNVGACDVRRTPNVKGGLRCEWSFDGNGGICLPPSISLSLSSFLPFWLLQPILCSVSFLFWPLYSFHCVVHYIFLAKVFIVSSVAGFIELLLKGSIRQSDSLFCMYWRSLIFVLRFICVSYTVTCDTVIEYFGGTYICSTVNRHRFCIIIYFKTFVNVRWNLPCPKCIFFVNKSAPDPS